MNNPKWIHAEERLPPSGTDVFILCEDSERMTGDRGTILSLQKSGYRDILWLDESGLEKDEQAEGKGNPEYQFLEFTSAHYKKGFDHFSIWMKDDNGKSYVTEFNGKFGRLLFAPQLVKKAAKVREVLEMLLEGWGDEWTDYTKKLVEKTIARAKNWTEKTPGAPPSVEADQQVPETKPWPLHCYAPGNYQCKCAICKTSFQGDKRGVVCLECAIIQTKEFIATMYQQIATLRSSGQIVASENKRDMEIVKGERDGLKVERDEYKKGLEDLNTELDDIWNTPAISSKVADWVIKRICYAQQKTLATLNKFTNNKDNDHE